MSDHPAPLPAREAARLARAVLALGREIELRHDDDPRIVRLTPTERVIMRFVDEHGDVAPSEIASRLALQRSNVSAALRGLVEKGLVERTGDAADRRAAHVRATPLARENLERLAGVWAGALGRALPRGVDAAALAGILERADASLAAERTAR